MRFVPVQDFSTSAILDLISQSDFILHVCLGPSGGPTEYLHPDYKVTNKLMKTFMKYLFPGLFVPRKKQGGVVYGVSFKSCIKNKSTTVS